MILHRSVTSLLCIISQTQARLQTQPHMCTPAPDPPPAPLPQGRMVSFKNSIIIMTSNLGSSLIMDLPQDDKEAVRNFVMAGVSDQDSDGGRECEVGAA